MRPAADSDGLAGPSRFRKEHQGIADVKPVAEQGTDKSDAPEMVPKTQSELDFKQAMASSNIAACHQDERQPIPNSENVVDDTDHY